MLKMLKMLPGVRIVNAVRMVRPAATTVTVPTRADLQIRNLLDDPGLRRTMGLDRPSSVEPVERLSDAGQDHVPVQLVTPQPEALADLRQVVRNAAA